MTEVAAERQAPAQAPPAPPPPDTTPNAPSAPAAKVDKPEDVQQTAGGWPVVPLALTGTNTTVTVASSAALAGAGPVVALAAAATGAAVLGAATLVGRRKSQPRKNSGVGRNGRGAAGFHRSAGLGRGGARSGGFMGGSRSGRSSYGAARGAGGGRTPLKSPSPSRTSLTKGAAASSRTGTPPGRSGSSVGRIQQVRALRQPGSTGAGGGSTRSQQRAQTAQARRQAADTRRAQAATRRSTTAAGRGRIGRGVSAAVGRAARLRDRALENTRARRDRLAKERLGRERRKVRTARIRRSARWALLRSALRFQHRRLWAALAAGALGVVGLVTTPLGRRLGWAWLQHPGRRLYRRLMGRARAAREARDAEIREAAGIAEAALHEAAERDGSEIADRVERPEPLVAGPAPAGTGDTVSTSGWKFEEAAAEMEAAAQAYQPDDCMEILAMVQGLPQALTSISNVMKILAERSDSEFPLEKEVADQFADLHGSLMGTVAVADDMENVFRQAHASDIARFEDPRNGYEAEKGWNI
ncbi:hypothetical protein ACF06T_14985 [Streptomyces albidoflavus]